MAGTIGAAPKPAEARTRVGSGHPQRVVAAAREGLGLALNGKRVVVSDRLWAYEIEEAALELATAETVAHFVRVRACGDKVSFEPAGSATG